MTFAAMLTLALILDAFLGEPGWLWSRLPHPAVLMGKLVDYLDLRFNQGGMRRVKGVVTTGVLILVGALISIAISSLPYSEFLQIPLVAILLAQRSLVEHVRAVAVAFETSLRIARQSVSMIVGRDTSDLDESAIARAAIESAAENFSDGVVAPAFWFLVAGLPGIVVYKIINTADSMIGHKSDRYREFGWAAARLDDVVNWAPARLSAIFIAVGNLQPSAWRVVKSDASLHRSPNAGWPEAAMAAVVGIALSGPRSYGSAMQAFPYVNTSGRHNSGRHDISNSVGALWRSWALCLFVVAALAVACS